MFRKEFIIYAVLLAGSLGYVQVAQAALPGFYYGVSFGQGHDVVLNQDASAAKVSFGMNINPYLGLEMSYVNLGNNYIDIYNNSFTQNGVSYELVGYLPISPTMDLFAKIGSFDWVVSDNYYNNAYSNGTDSDYGVGISIPLTRRIWLRAEYQKFQNVAGGDVHLTSAGLTFYFLSR